MRSEIHEPGRGKLTSASQTLRSTPTALHASAIDAALGDEATLSTSNAPTRREMPATNGPDAMRVVVDRPHPSASASNVAGDEGLLRQLSRQLEMLEVQQRQIRRLLEQTEQRATTRRDR